jgi:tetratricopeptide (TPR) repeat protein
MNLSDCYQVLGLKLGAPLDEVKGAYRRLARQYHPDVNADEKSKEKFIAISNAYQSLLQLAQRTEGRIGRASQPAPAPSVTPQPQASSIPEVPKPPVTPSPPVERPGVKVKVQVRQATPPPQAVSLSPEEMQLKQSGFKQLQDLMKQKRFPRAVALAEGLAQRLSQDTEVRQWQAIAYQQLGRDLIGQHELDKARIYLKKALKTDPHNRSLWAEIENDFRYLERQLQRKKPR